MALFFQKERTTTVEVIDGDVLITQFTDDDCDEETGQILISRRQFEEMFNRSKRLFSGEE